MHKFLQPSWKTLFDYSALPEASKSATAICRSLDKVLNIRENSGKTHGDWRSVNIIINLSQTSKVIFFDDDSGKSRMNIKIVPYATFRVARWCNF
jgi:hypothetical protein